MRKVTRYLIWLFVFTVPWDVVSLPVVGSASRAFGLAAVGAAMLTTLVEGRFRKPDAVCLAAIGFGFWSGLTLLWTISYPDTMTRVITYVQVIVSVLMVRGFVRTREELQPLLAAFCFGTFVPLIDLLQNFRDNEQITMKGRFSGAGVNADTLGLMLMIVLPMAWHLILNRRGVVRVVAVIYFILAPLALLLTGTRGAFIAGLAAMTIVPLTLPRLSGRSYALVAGLVIVAAVAAVTVVPQKSWTRILSIQTELAGGAMTGRRDLWMAGLAVFPERPILGAGAGAYGPAVQRILNTPDSAPHNLPIGLLVEEGVVGLLLFGALFATAGWTISSMPPPHRALWGVVMVTLALGVQSVNWEYQKTTWLLFGLVASQSGLASGMAGASLERRRRISYAAPHAFMDRAQQPRAARGTAQG